MDRFKVIKVKNENPAGLAGGIHLNRYDVATEKAPETNGRKISLAQLTKYDWFFLF